MALKTIHASALKNLAPFHIIQPTHFVARGLNVVFGPSGSFKSFYVLSQAAHVATEMPVIYVAAEGSAGLQQRLDAWCSYYKTEIPEHLYFICDSVNLLSGESVIELQNEVRTVAKESKKGVLVVFDTYAQCMWGGDENSAKDTGIVVRSCSLLQKHQRASVVLVHHTGKNGQSERGSSALRGAADLMIEIGVSNSIIRVECSKSKDRVPWEMERYRFLPIGNDSGVLLPADQVPESSQLSTPELKVLETLCLAIFDPAGARSQQIIRSTGLSDRTVFRALSNLKNLGLAEQDGKGDPYRVTSDGRIASKTRGLTDDMNRFNSLED